MIIYESLERSVTKLKEALERYEESSNDTLVRDALIKRFEFTYGISHRLLKCYLKETSASTEGIDIMTFPTLIRTAAERGLLLNSWDAWKDYSKVYNKTACEYDDDMSTEILAITRNFLFDIHYFLQQLQDRDA